MNNTINANTPTPFTVTRHIWTCDANGDNDRLLKSVRITIESADFSKDVVEEEGFSGDWIIHIGDDARWAGLNDEQSEIACDSACHFVEDLAYRLSQGESVSADADDDREWHPKASWNF